MEVGRCEEVGSGKVWERTDENEKCLNRSLGCPICSKSIEK